MYTPETPVSLYKMGFKGNKFHEHVTVNPDWVWKSFTSPVPSCVMHEALRTGLVSNYSMCGEALWASPSVSERVQKCLTFR